MSYFECGGKHRGKKEEWLGDRQEYLNEIVLPQWDKIAGKYGNMETWKAGRQQTEEIWEALGKHRLSH